MKVRIVWWLIVALAHLPLSVLYIFSDILYFLIRYIVRYRVKVVRQNLQESFPALSFEERSRIERQFYRNLADYAVETIKLAHISDEEMKHRLVYEDIEIIDNLMKSGRSITAYFSHCGNWEWAPSITLWSALKPESDAVFAQVYRPLKSKITDEIYLRLRARFGSRSFKKKSVFRDLILLKRDGLVSMTGFMSDQKPSHGDPTYVTRFLHHPTAMITGTETVARKLDDAVVYMDMYKLSRGKYEIKLRMIAENPNELPPMEITGRYTSMLQETILRNPAIWLWTHKRWKIPVEMPVADDVVLHTEQSTAVVILNWNGSGLLKKYLPSVVKYTPCTVAKVVVVDNGSTDNSVELIRREFPDVDLIEFDRNYGFAEGYNKALSMIDCKYAVLLNSDVEVTPGWIEPLVEHMNSSPECAGCQPVIRSVANPAMFEYAGAAGGWLDKNGYPYCRGRVFGTLEADNGQYSKKTCHIFWASGAALMVRRELYNSCGGLDPLFFAHMEEIDLCWRMQNAGYSIDLVPESHVYHLGGGSLPVSNPRKTYLNFRNNLLMLHKNLPDSCRGKILVRRRLLDTLAWVKFVVTFDWPNAAAIVRAHRHFAKMKDGYCIHPSENILERYPQSRKNILIEYYIKRHRKYSDINAEH